MSVFLEIDHVDKVFPLTGGGSYVALKNIELQIRQGEFVTLIGHSGCGKSTLLSIVAGLDQPSVGGVVLEGRQVTSPGPDRMMVFQNYSLLPWLTVEQNIALAVDKVLNHLPKGERKGIVEQNIDLVGLRPAAHRKPKELSGGMKQRVAIARALAIRPKMLLLDEPFGALDALTRGNLQEQLMRICEESQVTCLMVTHDVDEALLLSDRVVMLTNGPAAHIGQILEVSIPRPRKRMEVVKHPSYYALRNEIIYFLNQQKRDKKRKVTETVKVAIARNGLEKVNLDIGFIPLTDCAPLIIAQEQGFFKKHGLEEVTLHREPSWTTIADSITEGRLDAAQMVAGMPLGLTLGMNGKAPLPVLTAMVLSRNGDAVTISKKLYDRGVRSLEDLKRFINQTPGETYTLGVVHPASMQNLLLRYWLASGGIDPDRDINLITVPPPQMVASLEAGILDGFCVGEPWNSRAVQEGLGVVLTTTHDLWTGHPEKVLGVREDWANKYPATHLALMKALLEACEYCDDRRHREDMVKLLAKPEYVGADASYIRPGFLDPYAYGGDRKPESILRFNQFHIDQTNCPQRVGALWILTQLARWEIIPAFPKNWVEILERVRRVELYSEAARQVGYPGTEPNRNDLTLFDGVVFNPNEPISYLKSLGIGHEVHVEEVLLDVPIDRVKSAA